MAVHSRTEDRQNAGPARRVVSKGAPLLIAAIGIVGVMWVLGSLLVNVAPPTLIHWDDQISEWAFQHRTPTLDQLTHICTMAADTITGVAVTAVAVVALRLWLGRWRDSLVLVVAVIGELLIFLAITATVHRDRPAVPHLDPAPPTSSFPSGHTGVAIALYGCLAVILLRTVTRRWVAMTLAALCCAIPVLVAASRVYRGMHFVSDVLAGALASGIWLTIVLLVLLPAGPRPSRTRSEHR